MGALLGLLALVMPRIFEDIAQVRFIYTGKPWNDITAAASMSPNFLVWEIAVFALDLLTIFLLAWQILRNDRKTTEM